VLLTGILSAEPGKHVTERRAMSFAAPGGLPCRHLDGTRFIGINGDRVLSFNEAVSFTIECCDQDEVDY
jgi:3-demethylubiquinone-9 3-methyltransferase